MERPKRLFTKNTGLCRSRKATYRSDACPVPEGHAEELAARRSPEAKPR